MENGIDLLSVRQINRFDGGAPTKAFCDVAVADTFLIKGIEILQGEGGLSVSMPRQQGKDGAWCDVVVPLSKEVRQWISETVLRAYQLSEI